MQKIIVFILTIILFTGCAVENNEVNVKEIKDYISSIKTIGNTVTVSVVKPTHLKIAIVPEKSIFEHSEHRNMMAANILTEVFSEKTLNTEFVYKRENGRIERLLYEKWEVDSIRNVFQDSTLSAIVSYSVNHFNQYDPGILDGYLEVVYQDFPTMFKTTYSSFYQLITSFNTNTINNPNNDDAKKALLLLYGMDKELDILKSGSRYAKIIEGIWEIISEEPIAISEEKWFSNNM